MENTSVKIRVMTEPKARAGRGAGFSGFRAIDEVGTIVEVVIPSQLAKEVKKNTYLEVKNVAKNATSNTIRGTDNTKVMYL